MANLKTWKERLDWLGYGKLLVDIAIAIGGFKAVKNTLGLIHHVPMVWISPIAWLVAALILWGMIRYVKWGPKTYTSIQTGLSNVQPLLGTREHTLAPDFDINEFFRVAYFSPLSQEVAKNVRYLAHKESPEDPESFYLKLIGTGLVQATNEDIWLRIFRSQLEALLEVNRNNGIVPLSKVRAFYDSAAETYPQEYASESFDRWMSFLIMNTLLLRHPSDMVEITVKGKDFLKYLTHWGRDQKDKRL